MRWRYLVLLLWVLMMSQWGWAINTNDSKQVFAQYIANQGDTYISDRVPDLLGKGIQHCSSEGTKGTDTYRLVMNTSHNGCPNCSHEELVWDPRTPDGYHCRYCNTTYPNAQYPETETRTFTHWDTGTVTVPCYVDANGTPYYISMHTDGFQFVYAKTMADALTYTYSKTGDDIFAERARTIFLRYAERLPGYACMQAGGPENHNYASRRQALWVDLGWGYRYSFTLPNDYSGYLSRIKNAPALAANYNGQSYYDYIRKNFLGYLLRYIMSYNEDHATLDNIGGIPKALFSFIKDHKIPEAAHFLRRYTLRALYTYTTNYDGMSIEGPSYHSLWYKNTMKQSYSLIGYQDEPGYVDSVDGLSFTTPLKYDDLYLYGSRLQTLKFAERAIDLPNGTWAGVHDNRNTHKDGSHTKSCRSRILPGFGHLTMGDGTGDDQVQTQLHFSHYGGHSHDDSLVYQLYAKGRPIFEFSGHQDYLRSTINKSTVMVNHRGQGRSNSRGHLLFYTPHAQGVKIARVAADDIGFSGANMTRYRRTLIQNTIDIKRPYVLDVFDVTGGNLHEYLLAGAMFYEQSALANISMTTNTNEYPYYASGDDSTWKYYKQGTAASIAPNTYVDFTFDDGHPGAARVYVPGHEGDELLLSRLYKKPNVYREVDQVEHRPHMMIRRSSPLGASDPLDSRFVTVQEAYGTTPFIQSVTRHPLNDGAIAVVVELADRTDTYLIALQDTAQAMSYGACRSDGVIAAFTQSKTGSESDAWLVGGTLATVESRSALSEHAVQTGSLLAIQRMENKGYWYDGSFARQLPAPDATLNLYGENGFITDMDLPIGFELHGQMIYLDGYSTSGDRKVVNGFEIIEVKPGQQAGQVLVVTRQDSGARLNSDGSLKFLIYPGGDYAAGTFQLRFVPQASTVPRIAHVSPQKDRHPPEVRQGVDEQPFRGSLQPEVTTFPSGKQVRYALNGQSETFALNHDSISDGDATVTFSVANPDGVMQPSAQTEIYRRVEPARQADVQTPGLFWEQGSSIVNNLQYDTLAPLSGGTVTLKGWINAPQDGVYTFYVSVMGSESLEIAGHTLLAWKNRDSNGLEDVSIPLDAGWHPIEYTFYDNSSTNPQFIMWSGPGFDRQEIPGSQFATTLTNYQDNVVLSYQAGPGGTLLGETLQNIASGTDGSTVFAQAADGYRFLSWSDGTTAPLHQMFSVTTDQTVTANFEVLPAGVGFTREIWEGISGNELTNLTTHANYPNNPTVTLLETKLDIGTYKQYYGQRISGMIRAPLTGDYIFDISADDQAELWLSSDANATNSAKVASVPSWTNPHTYNKSSEQTSAPVSLVAGEVYFLQVLHKNGGGGDHCSVRWLMPGQDTPVIIDASYVATNTTSVPPSHPSFTITYTCDSSRGSISGGSATQSVEKYQQTLDVTATPKTGYRFLRWSDGYSNPTRSDTVLGDTTFTALFDREEVNIHYVLGPNGSLAGVLTQSIPIGQTSSSVTAVPDAGYRFDKWSDGLTDATRSDVAVTNVSLQAQFTTQYPSVDSDGDGLSDVDEVLTHHTDPGLEDTDFDGVSDYWEIQTGSDPNDPNSYTHFTLTYSVQTNGFIEGVASQTVPAGQDATIICAQSAEGYIFDGWSDGVNLPHRWDRNVQSNLNVTANFRPIQATEGFALERWEGISGDDVSNLTTHVNYPNTPTSVTNTSSLSILDEKGSNYGRKISGMIRAPITGTYYFRVGSDDSAELWLGTDATEASKHKIAECTSWVKPGSFSRSSQISGGITLQAGQAYYIELLHKEGGGGDYVDVDWKLPHTLAFVNIDAFYATDNPNPMSMYQNAFKWRLSYAADGKHGGLTGATSQLVVDGGAGTTVTATPHPGYRFVGWSDGYLNAARTDSNVHGDLHVNALFMDGTSSGSGFEAWAILKGLAVPNNTRQADHDFDGVINFVEYALDMDPNQLDAHRVGSYTLLANGDVEYRFAKPIPSVTYKVQYSTDLTGTWTDFSGAQTDHGSDLSVLIPSTLGNGGKLFIRLRLEE